MMVRLEDSEIEQYLEENPLKLIRRTQLPKSLEPVWGKSCYVRRRRLLSCS